MSGWGGEFDPELSSLSSGINVFYSLIWSCLNVKCSLSRADGSGEHVAKKARDDNLAFYKKIDDEFRRFGGAF